MRSFLITVAIGAALGLAGGAQAQTPTPAPQTAPPAAPMTPATIAPAPGASAGPIIAICRDGSNYSGKSRSGACRGHGGVQAFAGAGAPGAAVPAAPAPAAPAPAEATPATTAGPSSVAAKPAKAARRSRPPTSQAAQAPGGGPGLVWVNSTTKIYHCSTDRYYGRTKTGEYMSEDAAKAAGDKPTRGKACS